MGGRLGMQQRAKEEIVAENFSDRIEERESLRSPRHSKRSTKTKRTCYKQERKDRLYVKEGQADNRPLSRSNRVQKTGNDTLSMLIKK